MSSQHEYYVFVIIFVPWSPLKVSASAGHDSALSWLEAAIPPGDMYSGPAQDTALNHGEMTAMSLFCVTLCAVTHIIILTILRPHGNKISVTSCHPQSTTVLSNEL